MFNFKEEKIKIKEKEKPQYDINNTIVIWLDTETTGLDAYRCDMITACFLIEENGEISDTLTMQVQPFAWENISKEAEKVHGITSTMMIDFKKPEKSFIEDLLPFLRENYNGKQFILAGQNIAFDRKHLNAYWGKCKSKLSGITYYGIDMLYKLSSVDLWFNVHMIDCMYLGRFCQKKGLTNFINKATGKKSVKLEVMCDELNIEYDSHDAIDDIIATKIVAHRLWNRIKNNKEALLEFEEQYPLMHDVFASGLIKEMDET